MLSELRELWRFRELLWAMTERELRIRYKNSVLGFFWSLVNPLATVFVMTIVFKFIFVNNTPNFSAYILAAYLPFLFFQFVIMDSAQSVLAALPVVRKVYFPREILPLSSILANFINFLLALLVFFAFLFGVYAIYGFEVSPFTWRILFLPVLLIVSLSLASGLALLVSALNVLYEDIKYMVGVLLYLLFFLTPIMYFSETVYYNLVLRFGETGKLLYVLYHLNPLAMLATAYRKSLVPPGQIDIGRKGLGNEPDLVNALPFDWVLFGIAVAVSFALLYFGYWTFNRLKWRFVERP